MKRYVGRVAVGLVAVFAALVVLESQADAFFGRFRRGGRHHGGCGYQESCCPPQNCCVQETACCEPEPVCCESHCGCDKGCGHHGRRHRRHRHRGCCEPCGHYKGCGGCGCNGVYGGEVVREGQVIYEGGPGPEGQPVPEAPEEPRDGQPDRADGQPQGPDA